MMDEVDFELCLDIDQYVSNSTSSVSYLVEIIRNPGGRQTYIFIKNNQKKNR